MPIPATSAAPRLDVDVDAVACNWRGHLVRVRGELLRRTLYLTADLTVEIDGHIVLHTGGQKKATGLVHSSWLNDGVRRPVSLAWGLAQSTCAFPVTVVIDGDTVLHDEPVRLANPGMVWLLPGALLLLVMLAGVLAFLLNVR